MHQSTLNNILISYKEFKMLVGIKKMFKNGKNVVFNYFKIMLK